MGKAVISSKNFFERSRMAVTFFCCKVIHSVNYTLYYEINRTQKLGQENVSLKLLLKVFT